MICPHSSGKEICMCEWAREIENEMQVNDMVDLRGQLESDLIFQIQKYFYKIYNMAFTK